MQAAFHTKNIGSLMLRPGGSVEIFIEKDCKMSSKNLFKNNNLYQDEWNF